MVQQARQITSIDRMIIQGKLINLEIKLKAAIRGLAQPDKVIFYHELEPIMIEASAVLDALLNPRESGG